MSEGEALMKGIYLTTAKGQDFSAVKALNADQAGTSWIPSFAVRANFHARSLFSAKWDSSELLGGTRTDVSLTTGGSGRLSGLLYLQNFQASSKSFVKLLIQRRVWYTWKKGSNLNKISPHGLLCLFTVTPALHLKNMEKLLFWDTLIFL